MVGFTQPLKLTRIGTSTGVILPKEMLTRFKVQKGDSLYAIETADGYLVTPYDPSIEEQLTAGREFMKEFRETFKILANEESPQVDQQESSLAIARGESRPVWWSKRPAR